MKLKLAGAGFLVLISLALQPVPKLCARPACQLSREFYTDNTFTETVGLYVVSCSSGVITTGHSSCYYEHIEQGECGNGYGGCGGFDFRCSNQVITDASNPAYIGAACSCYPVF